MSDKIVYVHPDHESDAVTIITPKGLDALLEEGWRIQDRKRQKVTGKMVDVLHLTKVEQRNDRGLAVRRPGGAVRRRDEDEEDHPHSTSMSVLGEQCLPGSGGALVPRGGAPGGGSFLGGGSDFAGMPGMQVAGSMVIQHAFSMGVDAAHAGRPESDCPWPAGDVGATQWLKGYRAGKKSITGGGTDPAGGATQDAYDAGKQAAQGDADLQVHCPYPVGTAHYDEWLRGFSENGGKVE